MDCRAGSRKRSRRVGLGTRADRGRTGYLPVANPAHSQMSHAANRYKIGKFEFQRAVLMAGLHLKFDFRKSEF